MDDPGEFFDPVAHFYDARISSDGKSGLADDVRFYRKLAREADGPVLEVGVGTGRIYLELLDEGITVDGIDLSEAMLEELRSAATDRNLDPSVWVEDVTDFDPDRQYDLIYAPNRVFNHLSTLEDQSAALQKIRRALAPDGRFVLNTFVPRFETVVEDYGEPQEDLIEIGEDTYRVVLTSYLHDEIEQVARLHHEVYRDGELVAERETSIALIPKRRFELLFRLVGFDSWTVHGKFDRDPLESATDEMVWVVHK